MLRTGFARREYTPAPAAPMRPLTRPVVLARCTSDAVRSAPKENAIYSEPYRRLVAALPCIYCGIHGYSQAAHPPPTAKGRKEDDRKCFPLCCTRPSVTGCHVEFDQYRLIPPGQMCEQAAAWGAKTRGRIMADGDWPVRLPFLPA